MQSVKTIDDQPLVQRETEIVVVRSGLGHETVLTGFWTDIMYPSIEENKRLMMQRFGEIKNSLKLLFGTTNSLIEYINSKTTMNLPKLEFNEMDSLENNVKTFQNVINEINTRFKQKIDIDTVKDLKDPQTLDTLRTIFGSITYAADITALITISTLLFTTIKGITQLCVTLAQAELTFAAECAVTGLSVVASSAIGGVAALGIDAIFSAIFGAIESSKMQDNKDNFYKASQPFLDRTIKTTEEIVRAKVRIEDKFETPTN